MPKTGSWKARQIVATVFKINGTPVDESTRLDWDVFKHKLRYISYQIERCPSSGNLHIQCYLEAKDQMRKAGVQELFKEKCFVEPAHLPHAAHDYTHKEDSRVVGPFTHGARVKSGERTDISRVSELILSGHTAAQILEELPDHFLRLQKGIERAIELRKSFPNTPWDENRPRKVIVITGPPGTGKTSSIIRQYGSQNVYDVQFVNGFFNGYLNQPVALFDDFDPSNFKFPFLLKLLDRYPITVNVKNRGDVQWNPQVVVITNNYSIDTWYIGQNIDRVALYRRLDAVLEIRDGKYIDCLQNYMATAPQLIPIDYAFPQICPSSSSGQCPPGGSDADSQSCASNVPDSHSASAVD